MLRMTPFRSIQVCTALGALLIVPAPAIAQDEPDRACTILCAPELKIEPTFTIEHLAQRPRVETDGAVERVIPGNGLRADLRRGYSDPNPAHRADARGHLHSVRRHIGPSVHGRAGNETGQSIRDNGIEIESELNFHLFDEEQTGGWVSSHVDIVDKFSPGETPRASSVYTHKLNFEWDTAFHVFNRLEQAPWLRNVEVELSLDYLATGLPKAGDVIGDERFLDKASPWSLSFVFVFPLAPLNP